MRTTEQILELLPQLDHVVADELEDQDLDFKEWNTRSTDDAVKLVIVSLKQDVSAPFRSFVAEETKQGRLPGVDELLVLQYLLRHTELETTLAAELCQRPEAAMRNTLSRMERDLGWIQRGGTGRGTYWTLSLPPCPKTVRRPTRVACAHRQRSRQNANPQHPETALRGEREWPQQQ